MSEFNFPAPAMFTVTALVEYLREMLESDEVLQDVWVQGELSNLSQPRSGHLYFTLKDSEAQVRCVMWKNAAFRLAFNPQDGLAVEAHGAMSVYPAGGQVQLYVDTLRPAGEGALFQEFLRLRARLEAEGLFDPAHKRALPPLPHHIGIVTSASGAALQDILNTLRRRLPITRVTIAGTPVQGVEAPSGIVRALQALNRIADLDLIIVARGGGSIEDLWAFNDEGVARAIFASRVPVISGVGHETDFTIADFVADVRAPTPTGAAEIATSLTVQELEADVQALNNELDSRIADQIQRRSQALQLAQLELRRNSPRARVQTALQRQDDLRERLERAMQMQLATQQYRLSAAKDRLELLSPLSVLGRGYAIVEEHASGRLVRRAGEARAGMGVWLRFADGRAGARIDPPETKEEQDA